MANTRHETITISNAASVIAKVNINTARTKKALKQGVIESGSGSLSNVERKDARRLGLH